MNFLLSDLNNPNINDTQILYDDIIFLQYKNILELIKNKIDNHFKEWEISKKMIHDFEYIYTSSNLKKNICKFNPISRSFFKLQEIIYYYHISTPKKALCLAEAPGGFIQCLLNLSPTISIFGITLLSQDKKIPYWNNSLLNRDNIQLLKGIHQNGDLYDLKNIFSFIQTIGKSSIDFITGDGGIDYSNDYNKQELNSLRLIYSEIFLALNLQSIHGTFICKIFDIFTQNTIQLIYLLYLSYEKIFIHKPSMSRFSNSEKYIICINFKGYNKTIINQMIHHFHDNSIRNNISKYFLDELNKFNQMYIHEQKKHIELGISYIQNNQLSTQPTPTQIEKGKLWCKKYHLPFNDQF